MKVLPASWYEVVTSNIETIRKGTMSFLLISFLITAGKYKDCVYTEAFPVYDERTDELFDDGNDALYHIAQLGRYKGIIFDTDQIRNTPLRIRLKTLSKNGIRVNQIAEYAPIK